MMIGEDTRGSSWCNVYNTIYSHREKFSTFSTIFNKSGLSPDFSRGEYNEPLPKLIRKVVNSPLPPPLHQQMVTLSD